MAKILYILLIFLLGIQDTFAAAKRESGGKRSASEERREADFRAALAKALDETAAHGRTGDGAGMTSSGEILRSTATAGSGGGGARASRGRSRSPTRERIVAAASMGTAAMYESAGEGGEVLTLAPTAAAAIAGSGAGSVSVRSRSRSPDGGAGGGGAVAASASSAWSNLVITSEAQLPSFVAEYNHILRQRYDNFIVSERGNSLTMLDPKGYVKDFENGHKHLGAKGREKNLARMIVSVLYERSHEPIHLYPKDIDMYFVSGFQTVFHEGKSYYNKDGCTYYFVDSQMSQRDFLEQLYELLFKNNTYNFYIKPILRSGGAIEQPPNDSALNSLAKRLLLWLGEKDHELLKGFGASKKDNYYGDLASDYFGHSEQAALIYFKKNIEPMIHKPDLGAAKAVLVTIITERDMCQFCFKTLYLFAKMNNAAGKVPIFFNFVVGTKEHGANIYYLPEGGAAGGAISSRSPYFVKEKLAPVIKLEEGRSLNLFVMEAGGGTSDETGGGASGSGGASAHA